MNLPDFFIFISMNKIIKLTENDIHSMIKECIHNVLVEGYSGKHFEDKVA